MQFSTKAVPHSADAISTLAKSRSDSRPAATSSTPAAANAPGSSLIRGSVDVVTDTEVRGWAFAPGRREPVMVQVLLNYEILGEGYADLHRPDLAAAGLGDGNSGYSIKLFRAIDPLYVPFLVVKVDGGDAELPRAPMLGFSEYFSTLFAAHPSTGRSRSVFGGLWTDRTDAAALLRGKTEIGQIATETAASVSQLITRGFALCELIVPQTEQVWRESLTEQVGSLFNDPALLTLLRSVLEDNPLVVKATWVTGGESGFYQASVHNTSPSPAECVELVMPFGEDVTVDVVRDSHQLPEFTPSGTSRWVSRTVDDGVRMASAHGLLDHYPAVANTVMVIGPGTLHDVRCRPGSAALQILCLPERTSSLAASEGSLRREHVGASKVRVLL